MSDNSPPSPNLKEFQYGRSTIEYLLVYEDRKNLAITVQPDKSVVVKAPIQGKFQEIQEKLQKHGQWILKQLNYFDKFHPLQPEREFVSGESHYYLGRQYRLRIKKDSPESIKLKGKFFIVRTKDPNNKEQIKFLMSQWYADHAQMLLDRRSGLFVHQILGPGFESIETKYKFLKQRWGSYDPKGLITFNIELIKTPIQCVDYVIVHELCHLVHPNHDKFFYRLLRNVLPNWKERKEKLELFGIK